MPKFETIKGSETLALVKKNAHQENGGKDIIRLDIGEPDLVTPQPIIDGAKKALDQGDTHYFSKRGPELKEMILKDQKRHGLDYTTDEILLSPGSKQAIFYSIFMTSKGKDVAMFDPTYPAYPDVTEINGGKAVRVNCGENFTPDVDALRKALTPNTSMVVITTPNNPTGRVYKKSLLEELADVAVDNDLFILSDEIYRDIVYDGKHQSVASLNGMKERTIVTCGFSKAYAMTGWRLGYICAPQDMIENMRSLHRQIAVTSTSFVQSAAISALDGSTDAELKAIQDEYKRRRNAMSSAFSEIDGLKFSAPEGALYCFPDFSDVTNLRGMDLFNALLEKGVSSVPGNFFGASYDSYLRFSISRPIERLELGLERIKEFCQTAAKPVSN